MIYFILQGTYDNHKASTYIVIDSKLSVWDLRKSFSFCHTSLEKWFIQGHYKLLTGIYLLILILEWSDEHVQDVTSA